ncbi:MAG: helix-turn-helix transcriptional regulator [Selenomonadales bacterium]|nr:helix-turn-helix transcriptional regulator [Selenomonadales bacterium]
MKIDKAKLGLVMANKMYSMKKVSERSGVSQVTISRIVCGKQKARPETVGKIARALNVQVADIIERRWGDETLTRA